MIQKPKKTPKKPAKAGADALFVKPGASRPKKALDGRAYAPTHQDRQLVMLMKVAGFTQERAARQLDWPYGIDPKTFRKYFAVEWESAEDRLHTILLGTQIAIATDKAHPKVAIAGLFLLKSRFGYRDREGVTIEAGLAEKAGQSEHPTKTVEFTIKIGDNAPKDA